MLISGRIVARLLRKDVFDVVHEGRRDVSGAREVAETVSCLLIRTDIKSAESNCIKCATTTA